MEAAGAAGVLMSSALHSGTLSDSRRFEEA
jgi:hypothetical protein